MGCYIVPTVAAIACYFIRKNNPSMKAKHYLWLNQLFLGGAIFGTIDHLWNGEFFTFGEKPLWDIALGITITLIIYGAWKLMVIHEKISAKHANKVLS
jgi:hypothetical protein